MLCHIFHSFLIKLPLSSFSNMALSLSAERFKQIILFNYHVKHSVPFEMIFQSLVSPGDKVDSLMGIGEKILEKNDEADAFFLLGLADAINSVALSADKQCKEVSGIDGCMVQRSLNPGAN